MKKIFTLISMALVAMSANAQTETESYNSVVVAADGTKSMATEFASATQEGGNKVVYINGQHVKVVGVASATPQRTQTAGLTAETWDSWTAAEWKLGKNKQIWHKNPDQNDKTAADYKIVDLDLNYVTGSGNPANGFDVKTVMNEGEPTGDYDPDFEGHYYLPDGSKGVPTLGEYIEFTADVDGMFKIGFWGNKGGNRHLYLVKKSDGKALATTEFKVEGYVNGCDNADGSPMYIASIKVSDDYLIGDDNFQLGWNDDEGNPKVSNQVNNEKFGWFVFDAKKDETYMIFGDSWQFQFRGYEFTPGATQEEYTPSDPTGIDAVKNAKNDNANAPIYNMAGQRVNKSYKGVVIQNGRKFVNK